MTAPVLGSSTYADLVLEALRRYPDRTAFVTADESIVSYADALDLLGRIRTVLRTTGLGHGDGLGALSSNRPDAWIAQYAGVVDGARFTPLHPLGSLDDHLFIIDDAELRILVLDPAAMLERGREIAAARPDLTILTLGPADIGTDLLAAAADAPPAGPPERTVTESDLALIVYTGGTTGRPKGVMLPHRSLLMMHLLMLAEWQWPPAPRFLAIAPITHATGGFVLPTLWLGGTVVMRKRFDTGEVLDAVARHRISVTFGVPSMVYALLEDPRVRKADLSSLRMFVYGAAPMAVPRLVEALDVFGPVFVQLYGQSECPNIVTSLGIEDHDPARPDRLASCGRPSPGITVSVLDESGAAVADGSIGELCVRGPLVMDGYWRRPEQTAETIRDGWLHTGDLAIRDAGGYLTLVGRAKDMIISGGFNVYPAEVEGPLLDHPDVAQAAVVGLPDPKWGEAVTAFVVLRPGAAVDPADLVALVRERKGPVQAPKAVHFVDSLPLTGLGKPDKKALRAQYGA